MHYNLLYSEISTPQASKTCHFRDVDIAGVSNYPCNYKDVSLWSGRALVSKDSVLEAIALQRQDSRLCLMQLGVLHAGWCARVWGLLGERGAPLSMSTSPDSAAAFLARASFFAARTAPTLRVVLSTACGTLAALLGSSCLMVGG